jgi:hypothetical protein
MRQHAKRLTHSDGAAYGLWFLGSAVEGATYELLPTEKGDYTEASGAYIPLPRFWTADPSQDRDQQLLSALAAGYYVSPPPSPLHDLSFFVRARTYLTHLAWWPRIESARSHSALESTKGRRTNPAALQTIVAKPGIDPGFTQRL